MILEATELHPVQYVYVLPQAGVVQLPVRALGDKLTVSDYVLMQLDFGQNTDSGRLDGTTTLTQLRRFSRSYALVKASR